MAAGFLAMVVRFRTQPGQDSERASLLSNEQRIHVLAEVLEQAPRFSYRVPDSDIMAQGTRRLYYAGASMSSPLRILAVDVGTGTQDILFFESGKTIENCFKLVMTWRWLSRWALRLSMMPRQRGERRIQRCCISSCRTSMPRLLSPRCEPSMSTLAWMLWQSQHLLTGLLLPVTATGVSASISLQRRCSASRCQVLLPIWPRRYPPA